MYPSDSLPNADLCVHSRILNHRVCQICVCLLIIPYIVIMLGTMSSSSSSSSQCCYHHRFIISMHQCRHHQSAPLLSVISSTLPYIYNHAFIFFFIPHMYFVLHNHTCTLSYLTTQVLCPKFNRTGTLSYITTHVLCPT